MKFTWLGHACFLIEQDGYRVLLDPYTGVEGYPPLADRKLRVHKILCSHGHFDHNAVDQAEAVPFDGPCPFTVRTVETFHDGQGGALRGNNTIHILSAGGVTAAHLGDLGHQLSPEQVKAVGPLDLAMIPVGGYYTIDAAGAKAVCQALNPTCVVPMHYRHAPYGLPVVAGVEDFLALWPSAEVRRLESPSLEADGARGVVVPGFCEVN
nr:MBL fold metallo-hydrolase [uncultured Oscillibacter sp.]